MIKAIFFALAAQVAVLVVTAGLAQAQTSCSYFSNANNCTPAAITGSDTSSKSNSPQNSAAQAMPAQTQSSFSQPNGKSDEEWNTQKKLYSQPSVSAQQPNMPPQKNGIQQNATTQQSSTPAVTVNSRQNANSVLTTNGSGQPIAPSMVSEGTVTNNGILKLSKQNLTSTMPNSLSSGAPNTLSNGSTLNVLGTPSPSLSTSSGPKVRVRSGDDDAPQKGVTARSGSTSTKGGSSSKSKSSSDSKGKDTSNCIFVGMQQVCG